MLLVFLEQGDRLPCGKTAIRFVEMTDLVFAELPAEADFAALVSAYKIDKPHLVVLQLAADGDQFVEIILKAGELGVEISLYGLLIARRKITRESDLQFMRELMGVDNVRDNPTDQRQRTVCLGEGKNTPGASGANRPRGEELWTGHNKDRLSIQDGMGTKPP
jgi:hypothetical protein